MTVSSAKTIYAFFYHLHRFGIKLVQHQYGTPGQRKLHLPLCLWVLWLIHSIWFFQTGNTNLTCFFVKNSFNISMEHLVKGKCIFPYISGFCGSFTPYGFSRPGNTNLTCFFVNYISQPLFIFINGNHPHSYFNVIVTDRIEIHLIGSICGNN